MRNNRSRRSVNAKNVNALRVQNEKSTVLSVNAESVHETALSVLPLYLENVRYVQKGYQRGFLGHCVCLSSFFSFFLKNKLILEL